MADTSMLLNCGANHTAELSTHAQNRWINSAEKEALGNHGSDDFLDILVRPSDGKILGIVSQGDYIIGTNSLRFHLKYLNAQGCIDAVCACQNKAKIQNSVTSYTSHSWVNKTLAVGIHNERIVNNADVVVIFNML